MKHVVSLILCSFLSLISVNDLNAEEKIDSYTLERAINQALQTNFRIQKARAEVKRSQGVYIEARASILPQVVGTGSYSKVDDKLIPKVNGVPMRIDRSWTARVEATQSLFVGGQDVLETLRDRLLKKAAVEALKGVINDVIFSVHEQFYRVLLNEAQLEVRKQAIDLLQQELESEKRKLDAGTVSNFNVLRADVALANAQTPFIRARNDMNLSVEEFRRLLGLPHKREDENVAIKVDGKLESFPVNTNLNEITEKALSNRPELHQLELELKADRRDVGSARAEFLPDVKAFAAYEEATTPTSSSEEDTVEGWEAGVRGEWRFFNSGESWGRVKQSKANRKISEVELEEVWVEVELDARRSTFSLIEANELVKASEKVVAQAEESLRLAQSRFDAGVATQLDLLDSQVALTNARTNRVQALFEFNSAFARVRRAMGEFVSE